MPENSAAMSREFLDQQRKRLEALRQELLGGERKAEADERAAQVVRGEETQDPSGQSADLAQREISQGLHEGDKRRLNDIERAIEKIADGTYGFSDFSGEPIPAARLKATPEAVLTVQEEEQREKKSR
jgi:DnaK suppressor protein